jgi:hypothetical protein
MKTTCALVIAGLSLLTTVNNSRAQPVLAVNVSSSGGHNTSNGSFTMGIEFTVNPGYNFDVDDLGFYDPVGSGNLVGLWNSSQTLLASATVTSTDPSIGSPATSSAISFNYVAITPVNLDPGTYIVAGTTGTSTATSSWWTSGSAATAVSGITFNNGVEHSSAAGTLTFPTGNGSTSQYFGADALGTLTAVPEPTDYALAGLSLLSVAGMREYRRRKDNKRGQS